MENSGAAKRILIVDDHAIVRAALAAEAGKFFAGHCVCAEASNVESALEAIQAFKPDIVFLDHILKSSDGIGILDHFQNSTSPRFIVVTQNQDPHIINTYFKSPALALISKSSQLQDIQEALRNYTQGHRFISPYLKELVVNFQGELMTRRELEIVRLISRGHSNKEVATSLGCSDQTIKSHKANIMAKLGVSTSVEVGVWASKNGLI